MLTPELERMIRKGTAEYKTYAVGGSGVGTIPCDAQKRIIITDFTWFPFCEVNPVNPIEQFDYFPTVQFSLQGLMGVINIGDQVDIYDGLTFKGSVMVVISVAGFFDGVVFSGDVSGPVNNCIDVDSGATANVIGAAPFATAPNLHPGTILMNLTTGATATVVSVTSAAPQGFTPATLTLNNIDGAFNDTDVIATDSLPGTPVIVQDGPMTVVTQNVPAIIEEAVQSCIHTLRFRSQSKEFVYNFRDIPQALMNSLMINQSTNLIFGDGDTTGDINNGNVVEFLGETFDAGQLLGWQLPDPTVVNCYLEMLETVQIDIWKFSPSGNVFTPGTPLPAESNEPDTPQGYRNAVANPAIRRIDTGQGVTIWPLGSVRDPAVTGARANNQFYDDIGDLTELALPLNNIGFPLVNIGYVLFNNTEK